jgi:hypothetical protein
VYAQRSQASSAWTSEAGTAFGTKVGALGDAADGTSTAASSVATEVDALAHALETAQAQMEEARQVARDGGIDVDGTVIQDIGDAPPDVAALPADASPAETAAYDQGMADIDAYDKKVKAWDAAIALADGADADWESAVENLGATWSAKGNDIVALFNDLLTGTAEAAAQFQVSKWYANSASTFSQQAAVYRQLAASYLVDGRVSPGNTGAFYDALDKARVNAALADGAKPAGVRVGTAVSRGFLALGVVATGVGIYTDMQDGESPAQAAVSNGGGFVASLAAGAGTGALVGSFIPIPGVGTAAGAIVGTIVGAGVGIVTSGMIDSMWENGVDNMGDVGEAIADGWGDLVDTGEAIGDLAGDAGDAVVGGISDAWDSVF